MLWYDGKGNNLMILWCNDLKVYRNERSDDLII